MTRYICRRNNFNKEKIKVLLVYPKVGAEAKVSLHLPLSILYLASYLEDYSVAIYDQRVDDDSMFIELLREKPICVGFSIMTGVQIKNALVLATRVKEVGIPTVFGGVHATILPEQTQQDERVDYVISGEGEAAFRDLVESLYERRQIGPILSNSKVDLERASQLPFELVDVENYVHSAMLSGRSLPFLFSRGCPFRCTFCCNPVISKCRWRTMDVGTAIERLNFMVEKFKLDGIAFMDENFTANSKILNDLAGRINGRFQWFAQSRANMLLKYDLSFLKRMGAQRFSCGLESGSPRMLEVIKKDEKIEEYIETNHRLAKAEINVWYNYIVGYPDETMEDLRMTINLAIQMLKDNPWANNSTFYLLTPYPGAAIADNEQMKAGMPNSLEGWADFGRHNFAANWHQAEMLKIYSRVCFSSKFVGRRLITAFPNDKELALFMKELLVKWEKFDFINDSEWEEINKKGWSILKNLFGVNAY
jgi:radical SAM superfamily enzyme YgiQ (UPF0313 family)